MKWFQLHTNCLFDPRIIKLIKKHGMAGFGVYVGINVLIGEKDKDDFTLEHDKEDLEAIFNEPLTDAIIETCIRYGLFTRSSGVLQNLKLSKYIGNWERRTKRYGVTTEPLQRSSVQKEEKEGRERKKEEKETAIKKSPLTATSSRPSANELFEQARTEALNKLKDQLPNV